MHEDSRGQILKPEVFFAVEAVPHRLNPPFRQFLCLFQRHLTTPDFMGRFIQNPDGHLGQVPDLHAFPFQERLLEIGQ